MQLIEMSITARVSASDFESIKRGESPRSYGLVDPSGEKPLVPSPTPILHVAGTDEGAILVDVVKTTEALFGRKRMPDELMNQAIMEANGLQVTPSMRTHSILTKVRMENAIRNDAWWTSEADLQLVEYATKLAAKASMSPSQIEPSTFLLSKEEKKIRAATASATVTKKTGGKRKKEKKKADSPRYYTFDDTLTLFQYRLLSVQMIKAEDDKAAEEEEPL
jgi:hypothetical protein